MKFGLLLAALALVINSQYVWSESIVDEFSRGIDIAVHKKTLPSLLSPNSSTPVLNEKPYPHLLSIFDRIKASIKPVVDDFELKLVDHGDLRCDRQRKYILVDLTILTKFTKQTTDPDLVFAALFAHEFAHYIFDITMNDFPDHDGPLGPMPIMVEGKEIPFTDYEHANTEGYACEILWRAGYKLPEIQKAYDDIFPTVQEILNDLKGDPSTDLASRRAIVAAWLKQKSLSLDAHPSQNETGPK